MVLALDIGNTNLTLGCIDDSRIHFVARLATDHVKTDVQYAIEIKNILAFYQIHLEELEGAIISSVVPPLSAPLKKAITLITGRETLLVGPGLKTGLNILIDNPAQLGSDLVVGAVSALHDYQPPVAIFDMGTATTISVIDKNGSYIGGHILPGVMISLATLSQRAAQLPDISLENPKTNIGRNTIDCMQSGIVNGNAAMLDGMLERIEDELGMAVTAVATGGISQFIIPHCKRHFIYDENMLLKGLYLLYKKNRKEAVKNERK